MVEEEEARKRVEEGVADRLEEELERRREEIESEVERRVAVAKLEMEVGVIAWSCVDSTRQYLRSHSQ